MGVPMLLVLLTLPLALPRGTELKNNPILKIDERESSHTAIDSARALFQRVLPANINALIDINTSTALDKDSFALSSHSSRLLIEGNTGVAISTGLGWFLKYYCGASVAWEGTQLNISLPIPTLPNRIVIKSAVKYRYYLNTCTHSYTLVWWNQWQKHIDWIALSGYNMVLAFTGQEHIFSQVFQQMGFSEAELSEWFTGPAFLAWNRMGNIRKYGGPLTAGWMNSQFQLQLQIISRLRELGILAVLPAFAGHVPPSFSTHFPQARVSNLPTWAGFNSTFSGDFVLDATDPMFAKINAAVITAQETAYNGTDHIFNADTYNEMVPASNDTTFLASQSKAVYQSFSAVDPLAVWMIQGWMFSFDKDFWQPTQVQAYLSGVPDDGMIILDLNAFGDPIWKQTNSFYGKPFVWSIINNGGQRPGMYGDLQKVVDDITDAREHSTSLIGVGVAPEGLFINYVMYELTVEMGWRSTSFDINDWTTKYVTRRYGLKSSDSRISVNPLRPSPSPSPSISPDMDLFDSSKPIPEPLSNFPTDDNTQTADASQLLLGAWNILLKDVYSTPYAQDYFLVSSRPGLNMGSGSDWTNVTAIATVWRMFHDASAGMAHSELFLFDYIDVTRQALSFLFEDIYFAFVQAYQTGDYDNLSTLSAALVDAVSDLDDILSTHPLWMVGQWIDTARWWATAAGDHQADLYESNARHLISIWGPNGELNSYAMRHFSGMMQDLVGARWKLFASQVLAALSNGTAFDQQAFEDDCFSRIEKPWAEGTNAYPSTPTSDPITVGHRLFWKYLGNITNSELSKEFEIFPNSDGNGNLFQNFRSQTNDVGQMRYLCRMMPACGGFIADGFFKPLNVLPVTFPGSTLYRKRTN